MNSQNDFQRGVIKPVECFREAWSIIKPHYVLLFAITVVGMLIGGITLYIALGAMICGIFRCYLDVVDGKEPDFEKLFKGFSYFVPSLLVLAVLVVPTLIVLAIMYVPMLLAAMSGKIMTQDEFFAMLAGTIAIELVVAFVMVCIHTLLMFAFPLIVDKDLSGWNAMKLSARAVWHNLNGVTGLWVVGFFVCLAGYLLLCVGIYLAIPIVVAANTVAYRKVFPALQPAV